MDLSESPNDALGLLFRLGIACRKALLHGVGKGGREGRRGGAKKTYLNAIGSGKTMRLC